jgi:superfamily II RNA helicase
MVIICDKPYPQENEEKYQEYFQKFPYPLSDFQKYSIEAIVDGNHTLVSAATGNGKTVSADFAIQHFVAQGKKVIYTCPIKSLSNQKFYDFSQKYPDIQFGIFTGDIKFNPSADVIFATAEILMNYLFSLKNDQGKEAESLPTTKLGTNEKTLLQLQVDIEHELGCVVMDECHFILDEDRGHVWENTILMLPQHIQMVLLSATLDQPERFARFCEQGQGAESLCKKQVVWSSTMKRIVPLTHYGFMTTIESIFKKVKDKTTQAEIRNCTNKLITLKTENGQFLDQGYMDIKKMRKLLETNQVYLKRSHVLNTLAKMLVEKEMLPALVFTFSRKNVEMCAKEITTNLLEFDSKIPYTIRREAEQILRGKIRNYQEYMEMPEYVQLMQLLEKGIGIHHSGMIPILREIVEFMISKRYIKMLFATDSFSIGLNCEIKTVVFTSVQKFDGDFEQFLMPHAYTQMAGRAGRRNIDTVGHVIHCNNLFELPSITDYKQILCGKPQKMESKFHISYSMILNLIRNGQNTHRDFVGFVNKSMLSMDLQESTQVLIQEQQTQSKEQDRLKTNIFTYLKTPVHVIKQYIDYKKELPNLVNKKRKEAERNMKQIEEEYRTCVSDVNSYNTIETAQQKLNDLDREIANNQSFVYSQLSRIMQIFQDRRFIDIPSANPSTNPEYKFTTMGHFASHIAEIHPLATAEIMFKYDFFEKFTPKQLVVFLSCFTDLRVKSDIIKHTPTITDNLVKQCVLDMNSVLVEYDNMEGDRGMNTGFKYNNAVIYDLLDEMGIWVDCENELSCKQFIQQTLGVEKQISVGDFTKAILKISAIAKEWIGMCEYEGKIGLMHKLQQIDPLILKYVCTTQSLYV